MQCDRAREILGAYLDRELSPDEQRAIDAHLANCRSCNSELAAEQLLAQAIRAQGRAAVPPGLAARVAAGLDRAANGNQADSAGAEAVPRARSWRSQSFAAQAAALVIACALSAGAAWWMASASVDTERLQHDLLAAHLRSLMQDQPVQVASSDQHTVRPWFAGRADFAPAVVDFADRGFPLIGGRLDYVDDHRVVAVVYKRRLHVINVFMWPMRNEGESLPLKTSRKGYNFVTWSRAGIVYWMVSDLDPREMETLAGML